MMPRPCLTGSASTLKAASGVLRLPSSSLLYEALSYILPVFHVNLTRGGGADGAPRPPSRIYPRTAHQRVNKRSFRELVARCLIDG